jgi:hypothetical protein
MAHDRKIEITVRRDMDDVQFANLIENVKLFLLGQQKVKATLREV